MGYGSVCETCARAGCRLRMDGLIHCDLHEPRETNWERLFGTPERAARTLLGSTALCRDCVLRDECGGMDDCLMSDYDVLLEWLGGDAE